MRYLLHSSDVGSAWDRSRTRLGPEVRKIFTPSKHSRFRPGGYRIAGLCLPQRSRALVEDGARHDRDLQGRPVRALGDAYMHHGQSRGNTRKVCKKQVNLSKTGGKFVKIGGKEKYFRETGGKCIETAKIGGKVEICGR